MTVDKKSVVRLESGDSAIRSRSFGADMIRVEISVGAGEQADWRIAGDGIAAEHAVFVFDGNHVWVRPVSGAVLVAGKSVSSWAQVPVGAMVQMAGVVLRHHEESKPASVPPNTFDSKPTVVQPGGAAKEILAAARRATPFPPIADLSNSKSDELAMDPARIRGSLSNPPQEMAIPAVAPLGLSELPTLSPDLGTKKASSGEPSASFDQPAATVVVSAHESSSAHQVMSPRLGKSARMKRDELAAAEKVSKSKGGITKSTLGSAFAMPPSGIDEDDDESNKPKSGRKYIALGVLVFAVAIAAAIFYVQDKRKNEVPAEVTLPGEAASRAIAETQQKRTDRVKSRAMDLLARENVAVQSYNSWRKKIRADLEAKKASKRKWAELDVDAEVESMVTRRHFELQTEVAGLLASGKYGQALKPLRQLHAETGNDQLKPVARVLERKLGCTREGGPRCD